MSLHRLRKSDTVPAVGRDIDTRCTKCKAELAHTILAMVGDVPARVKCNTCGSERKYRLSKAAATKKAGGTATKKKTVGSRRALPRKDEETLARERYERLLADRDPATGTPYNAKIEAVTGLVIGHKVFGPGVIHEVMGTKATVVFADGQRTLVVNR
ncbi:MAG: hypothetical protein KC502_01085 [Myxococcales bacterium]|nr:hypothetical protein [Myxococcales bacterium]